MAGKPKRMGQVKQIIRLYQQGLGKKTIAKRLGISKNTVRSYIQKIEKGQLSTGALLTLEEPVLEGRLFAGNPSYKCDTVKDDLGYYAKDLGKTGVTRRLLWEEYPGKHLKV